MSLCVGTGALRAQESRAFPDLPPQHAISKYGDFKYPPGFSHFAYVDPAAPKGGRIKLAATGTFDKLNPFNLKGVAATGAILLFDTLMEGAAVVFAMAYLLLAVRENVLCWLFAFLSTAIYTVLFWDVSLLMESALNVYYMAMAVYGWHQWTGELNRFSVLH